MSLGEQRLIGLEVQKESDPVEGACDRRVFVRMYVAARASGLLRAISDRDWKTLCALATYMDENGYCYPSQREVASALGISRQSVNSRIQALARFTFQGKPVVLVETNRRHDAGTGAQFASNGYRILPISELSIFNRAIGSRDAGPAPELSHEEAPDLVSRKLDAQGLVSRKLDTRFLDTNKIQEKNQKQQQFVIPAKLALDPDRGAGIQESSADAVVSLLVGKGISPAAARRLAASYPARRIDEMVEILEFLVGSKSPLVTKNPAGWLRRAIEDGYVPPPQFLEAKHAAARTAEAEKDAAQSRRQALLERARELQIPPERRAERTLNVLEELRRKLGRSGFSDQERSEQIESLTERNRQELKRFLREHPQTANQAGLPAGDLVECGGKLPHSKGRTRPRS